MELARSAGFKAIVLSSVWTPPLVGARRASELRALRSAVDAAAAAGIRPIVAVYSFSGDTPLTAAARSQFAAYAASIVRAIAGAARHQRRQRAELEPVLAAAVRRRRHRTRPRPRTSRCSRRRYDAIKAVAPQRHGDRRLARGARQRQAERAAPDPLADPVHRGPRRRATARAGATKPLIDLFSIHPYPRTRRSRRLSRTRTRPRSASPTTTKLVRLLTGAFGTPPPIVYGEYGVETHDPALRSSTSTPGARAAVDPSRSASARQARRLRRGDPPRRLPAARPDAALLPRHRRVRV